MQHLRILYINALREKRINQGVQKVGPGKSSQFLRVAENLFSYHGNLSKPRPNATPQETKPLLKDY